MSEIHNQRMMVELDEEVVVLLLLKELVPTEYE